MVGDRGDLLALAASYLMLAVQIGQHPRPALGRPRLRALLDRLGHESAVLVGSNQGCGVAQDAALRCQGLALRRVLFNGTSP